MRYNHRCHELEDHPRRSTPMKRHPVYPMLFAVLLAGTTGFPSPATAEDWPCWHSPRNDNISREKGLPTCWDPADATWKIAVPGTGHASPIVWGDRIYTVTGLAEKQDRVLICFDRATGNTVWQQTVVHGPLERLHPENSYASGTPVTDGKRVYVNFRVGDEIVAAAARCRQRKTSSGWSASERTKASGGSATCPCCIKIRLSSTATARASRSWSRSAVTMGIRSGVSIARTRESATPLHWCARWLAACNLSNAAIAA